ncbi:MAG: guanylate kinase [Nitrospirae bacterium]|nr:MAG: guanylate kinase [Nitrospirota bacterium]
MSDEPKPLLAVVSAPSGAGKTTLCNHLVERLPRLAYPLSHTTRPPRPGERDGREYHFVDRETFDRMRAEGAFLEWAEVHGNLYGTARDSVAGPLAAGHDVVVDVDIQGAESLRRAPGLAPVTIFVLPPSMEVLEQRLRARAQDPPEVIARRLKNAVREIAACDAFDYWVVNGTLDVAITTLESILRVRAGREADYAARDLEVQARPSPDRRKLISETFGV